MEQAKMELKRLRVVAVLSKNTEARKTAESISHPPIVSNAIHLRRMERILF